MPPLPIFSFTFTVPKSAIDEYGHVNNVIYVQWMQDAATRTIWLNPEPDYMWNGDSDIHKYAPLCSNVLKVSNLRELANAVDTLLAG